MAYHEFRIRFWNIHPTSRIRNLQTIRWGFVIRIIKFHAISWNIPKIQKSLRSNKVIRVLSHWKNALKGITRLNQYFIAIGNCTTGTLKIIRMQADRYKKQWFFWFVFMDCSKQAALSTAIYSESQKKC